MNSYSLFAFFCFFFVSVFLGAQSISEKKNQLMPIESPSVQDFDYAMAMVDKDLKSLKDELRSLFRQVSDLNEQGALESQYSELLQEIQQKRAELRNKETALREDMSAWIDDESYALMHAPGATVEELVIDYGAQDFLYLIPQGLAEKKFSICSALPIPKSSWNEMLELILAQNGIGIKQLNPYMKSLYLNKEESHASLEYICNRVEDLDLIPPYQRACFILSLEGSDRQRGYFFLNKFMDPHTTFLQAIGNEIVIVSSVEHIKDLLKLYDFVQSNPKAKEYKIVPLKKIEPKEMQEILEAFFFERSEKIEDKTQPEPYTPLVILPLGCSLNSLFLLGSGGDLDRAEEIVLDIENHIANPKEMTVNRYMCRYSEAEDLARILDQVYRVLLDISRGQTNNKPTDTQTSNKACETRNLYKIPPICDVPALVVNPKPVEPPKNPSYNTSYEASGNFIVDPKTGMIIMVVEQHTLGKLKDLIKKLDIPKQMIHLEVLLFEKKVTDQSQFGLNILQLGDAAKNKHLLGLKWSVDPFETATKGILDFFFSRKKTASGIPAYDFAYSFLISQEDVQIHSSPTVTTVNQTPAVIELVEEQSLDMGTVEDPKTSTISKTFVRAQYGIFIQITPTINIGSEDNQFQSYVTLETDITFDTTSSVKQKDRPDVSRRHIQNQVCIPDGQTVILGGLRRKTTEDGYDKIPFLGDIPGLGKLFSFSSQVDKTTEMFVFITPKIISDPITEYEKIRKEELNKRPGDIPEFLKSLSEAFELQQFKQMNHGLQSLFANRS